MAYTTDDLLNAVKRDSLLASAQSVFTDAQLLAIGDDQVLEHLAPLLVRVNENYYLETHDQVLKSGVSGYALPKYAMWNAAYMVALVDSDGYVVDLDRISAGDLEYRHAPTSGQPRQFYFDHDRIVLNPAPDSTSVSEYVLRTWIYRRPNRMVATSSAAVVSSVAAATGVITYTAAKPSTFTATSSHDAFSARSPFRRVATGMTATASPSGTTHTFPGPRTLGYTSLSSPFTVGQTVTGGTSAATGVIADISRTTLTLTGVSGTFQNAETITDTGGGSATTNTTLTNGLTDTDGIAPGDYVCVQDETVYPPVPIELHPYLKDLIIKAVSRAQMDVEQYQVAVQSIVEKAQQAIPAAIGNRAKAQPKVLSLFHSPFVRWAVGGRGSPSTRD